MRFKEGLLVCTCILPHNNLHHYTLTLGLGNYKLLPQFNAVTRAVDELDIIICHSPKEIVENIRKEKSASFISESGKSST